MRHLFRCMLLVLLAACGPYNPYMRDGWDVRPFLPHRASSYVTTPAGHYRDAGPLDSVLGGFVSHAQIDAAVDAGFVRFATLFPELRYPSGCFVNLNDDYVMYVPGAGWAGGVNYDHREVFVCLWTRGTSPLDPGAPFIKRPPDQNYTFWRYTAPPLVPALSHELLHSVIGDPGHSSALWARLDPAPSAKNSAIRGEICETETP